MLALATNELIGTLEETREYRKSVKNSDRERCLILDMNNTQCYKGRVTDTKLGKNGKNDQNLLLAEAVMNNVFLDKVAGSERYYSRYIFSQVLGEHDMNVKEEYGAWTTI